MPKQPKSEIRKDYFLNKYVVITPSRAKRPVDLREHTIKEKPGHCFLCPDGVEEKQVVEAFGQGKPWNFMVLKNKYPVFTDDNEKAYGRQEVLIETPDHGVILGELPEKTLEELLNLYSHRTVELSRDKKIEYVLVFKNQGSKAGASLAHAHSQIYATEFLPPDILHELTEAKKYYTATGHCPYCDIIKQEMKGRRKIFEDDSVAAFAPYASQHHYETWIFPKRHLDNITSLNAAEFSSFARSLKLILFKLHQLGLAYNFFMHQVISDNNQHFFLKIQPRENVWGGVELGSGLVINSVAPETAAKFYRA